MNAGVEIKIAVKGFTELGTKEKGFELIELLLKYNLQPLRYDVSERTKFTFEKDRFIKFWTEVEKDYGFGSPMIKGNGFYLSANWGGVKPYYSWLSASKKVYSGWESNWEEVLKFAKDFFKWNEVCHGYVSLDEEYSKNMASPGFTILDCLPGITWANLFGKPYVDMWGEEKLLKAPAWKTERLDDGGIMLVTTESPFTDPLVAAQAEEKLRLYLGKEYFYKTTTGEPGHLTLEELYGSIISGRKEPTGYIAPDFKKYYTM